jgi:hypothetical protein
VAAAEGVWREAKGGLRCHRSNGDGAGEGLERRHDLKIFRRQCVWVGDSGGGSLEMGGCRVRWPHDAGRRGPKRHVGCMNGSLSLHALARA